MKSCSIRLSFICVAALLVFQVSAQNILIDEVLASRSEPLKVKIGSQGFGKIAKWRFGEYSVVASKAGWVTTTSRSNLFNTKTESKTTQKFSFTLCNQSSDSAIVNAARNSKLKTVQGIELFPSIYIGDDELKLDSRSFTALINVTRDTLDSWILLMNSERGSESVNTAEAMLSNGTRKILIYPASSNKLGTDKRLLPALGYEFIENDLALLALQYYGGGILGLNKNIVWIDNTLDPGLKLILAAAATAIMQLRIDDSTMYE
jgi:hypothetical protein